MAKDKVDDLRKISAGVYWKNVLLEIYHFAPHQFGDSLKCSFYHNEHELAKKLKITGSELGLAITFLKDNDLIRDTISMHPNSNPLVNPSRSNQIPLTEKGFKVALDLEKQESNNQLQSKLVLFAGITALVGFFSINNSQNVTKPNLVFYAIGVIIVIIIAYSSWIKEKWKRHCVKTENKRVGEQFGI